MANPYQVLGVPRAADQETIKREYKRLARQFHPDRNPDPEAHERFKEISAAYDVLGDEKKRALFDEFGDVAFKPGFDEEAARFWSNGGGSRSTQRNPFDFGAGFSMDDILGSLFGDDARSRAGARRGEHQTVELVVDALMAVRGGEAFVSVRRPTGTTERLKVRIPPGARDGGKLRLKGQGHPPPGGGPCGDLLVKLTVPEHPSFRRVGEDLEMDVPITILEAMRGARITLPTPTGEVKITVPAGATAGHRLRVRGHGVPRPATPGDLFVILHPTVPASDDPAVIAAAEALESGYGGDVRKALKEKF
jgi:curved DNA-binding protein